MIIYTVEIDGRLYKNGPVQKQEFDNLPDAYDYARNYKRNFGDGSETCVIRKEEITVIDSFVV